MCPSYERFNRLKRVEVFTPIDVEGFILSHPSKLWSDRTSNSCRVAAQVVTGVEVLEILSLLEGIRVLKLPWIPISLHHDGFTVLARVDGLETAKEILSVYGDQRIKPLGVQSLELEFTPYDKPVLSEEEILKAEQLALKENIF